MSATSTPAPWSDGVASVPMVDAERVRKRFGRLEVLRGIDLRIERGTVTCVLGPSGSGKSTFLRCVNHLEKIDGGRLRVDGELVGYRQKGDTLHELTDRQVCRMRAQIGMVFQRFNLFPHLSALDNVTLAPLYVRRGTPASRTRRERARDGDALLLAAGELGGVGVGLVGEPDAVEEPSREVADLLAALAALGEGTAAHEPARALTARP